MAKDRYPRLLEKIDAALDDRGKSETLVGCMKRGRDSRAAALAALPGGAAFRNDVRAAKERCIENLPELTRRFIANAEKRGANIYQARDGAEAIAYCLALAARHGAKTVAKSKSLTTEEISLNHPLLAAGIEVVETDLGELIIQLANEKPFHLVFPSIHKMAPDVAELFAKATGKEVPAEIPAIMKVVREYLRPIFLNAEIGVTGANIGIAETGGICIETNEGNGRLVSSLGNCHICLIGMEKIVESIEDALLMVLAHPISASGQLPTTYVTWMHGRSPLGEGEAATVRESHIIILDNGRSQMRDDPDLREALYCIRCGACMNVCPTYGVVGGHTFGHIYPGPMGICWTAGVHGLELAADFAQLCLSCGLCKEICPAKINMPHMISEIKHRDAASNGHLLANRVMMAADKAARLGSAVAPLANAILANGMLRSLLEKGIGLAAERKLPPFAATNFMRRFRRRQPRVVAPRRQVALFVDVYANYNNPELAFKAVDALEDLGCRVIVPDQEVSGYPYIAYGGMDQARRIAASNTARLSPWVRQGWEVVAIEPTAAYALAVSYPTLTRGSAAAVLLAEHTFELFEYLNRLEEESGQRPAADLLTGRRFGYHCACHQRPLGEGRGAIAWLRRRGAEVELIESGTCCGMGGTFGLKSGALGYRLSQAVGQPLFTLFRQSGVEAIVTESSVCSIQLAEGTAMPVYHPLELLSLV
jgi:iron-sulfur cluster protein